MIVFNLSCNRAHQFEGWFGSADDFAAQAQAGNIACPICGSVEIEKQLSAPYVNTRSSEAPEQAQVPVASAVQSLRRKFIEYLLENTENVGRRFPEEARRIHYKEAPPRSIRGVASTSEVAELQEEGIEVMAVPDLQPPPDKLH